MSSYYNNAPRIYTPSPFKTEKQVKPIESFGTSMAAMSATPPPDIVNTCHRSRGVYMQHSHPRTYAILRKAEAERAAAQSL